MSSPMIPRLFSIDTTFDVKTPHGPGQFHLLVAPRDCPNVHVTTS